MNCVRIPPAGGELDVQQRRILLRRGQQDELPVRPVGVEVEVVVKLIPDLGRIAGQVDVEIVELRCLPSKVLERAVVAFDKGGRGDLDQVPEHQTALDEAFHVHSAFALFKALLITSHSALM